MRAIACFTVWIAVSAPLANGQPAARKSYEGLNAVVWTQRSAEYRALTLQTYQAARSSLRLALQDPGWSAAIEQQPPYRELPPAIILDLDETTLDNSTFNAELTREGASYTDPRWQKWVVREEALGVPGAVQFLNFVQSEGVAVFYVTNRVCDASSASDHTVAVLRKLSFPLLPSQLLCRANASQASDKSERRKLVASTHRILLLFGDDLNDFVTSPTSGDWKAQVEARFGIVQAHADKWGIRWFMLPNPMYGSWEKTIGYPVQSKLDALRP
jgi:acid phosphatase